MAKNVFLLIGASGDQNPLKAVVDEVYQIGRLFDANVIQQRLEEEHIDFEVRDFPSINKDILVDELTRSENNIRMIHFSGHSSSDTVRTDDGVVVIDRLIELIGGGPQKPLLVFINGCNSKGQVIDFWNVGAKCVIATREPVGDEQAAKFGVEFYKALVNHPDTPFHSAFVTARSVVSLGQHDAESRSLSSKIIERMDEPEPQWKWGIFAHEDWDKKNGLYSILLREEPEVDLPPPMPDPDVKSSLPGNKVIFTGVAVVTAIAIGFILFNGGSSMLKPTTEPEPVRTEKGIEEQNDPYWRGTLVRSEPSSGNDSTTSPEHQQLVEVFKEFVRVTQGESLLRPNSNSTAKAWLSTDDPCEWKYITCDREGIELKIRRSSLRGTLTAALEPLLKIKDHLIRLDVESNLLKGGIPETIKRFKRLKLLNLTDNRLTGTIPNSLTELPVLESLYLGRNELEGPIPKKIRQLKRLQRLRLDARGVNHKKISGEIPKELGELSQLYELILTRQNLQGTIPKSLADTNLTNLHLAQNNLSGQVPQEIWNHGGWEDLRIQGNPGLEGRIPMDYKGRTTGGSRGFGQLDITDTKICIENDEGLKAKFRNTEGWKYSGLVCPDAL